MSDTFIRLAYKIECACGMPLTLEIHDANNLIVVMPCVHCEEKRMKQAYETEMRSKSGLILNMLERWNLQLKQLMEKETKTT